MEFWLGLMNRFKKAPNKVKTLAQGRTIPFFVVDRPMSLRLLESCGIKNVPFKVGLMGNANTTKEFQEKFRNFNGTNIVKMADSGVFTKHGAKSPNYRHLFDTYVNMGTEYGIIIDIIKDKKATLRKAKEAMITYKKEGYDKKFGLVGVAQGKTVDDYVECYKELKKMGFNHIAIGGLLKKRENTARYVHVRDEDFIEEVVGAIRKDYPDDWIFLLGAYSPNRQHRFDNMGIFGADFKGWILNYDPPETRIDEIEEKLRRIEKTLKSRKDRRSLRRAKVIAVRTKPKSMKHAAAIDKLASLRLIIGKRVKDKIYLELVKEQAMLRSSDEDDRRQKRFKEVYDYLHKNVYGKMKPRKLLIVSCSDKKRGYQWPEKAINVYDGPMFHILRKSDVLKNGVDLRIISGKFGIMAPNKPIRPYDQRITKEKAKRLNAQVLEHLKMTLERANYDEIRICLGKDYMEALKGLPEIIPEGCSIVPIEGKIGQKLHGVKKWLSEQEEYAKGEITTPDPIKNVAR